MSLQTDIEVLKDIPGYKAILKSVLKTQIQLLIEQLADNTGEESIILTASINDGTLSHLGSNTGKGFLEGRDEIKSQFLGYCLKSHHRKKPEVTSPSFQSRSQSGPQLASRRPRIRPAPYSVTSPGSSHSQMLPTSSTISSQRPTTYHQNNTVKSEPTGDGDSFLDKVSGGSEEEFSSGVPGMMGRDGEGDTYGDVSGHLSHGQDGADSHDKSRLSGDIQTKLEPGTEDLVMEGSGIEGDGWGQHAGYSGGDEETAGMAGVQGASGYSHSQDYVYGRPSPGLMDMINAHYPPYTPGDGEGPNPAPSRYSPYNPGDGEGLNLSKSSTTALDTSHGSDSSPSTGPEKLYTSSVVNQDGVRYRLYKCNFCGKEAHRKGDLDRHVLKHTRQKPFKCIVCHRAFTRKQILLSHIARMHRDWAIAHNNGGTDVNGGTGEQRMSEWLPLHFEANLTDTDGTADLTCKQPVPVALRRVANHGETTAVNQDCANSSVDLACPGKEVVDHGGDSEHADTRCTTCIALEQAVASLEQENNQLKRAAKKPALDYSMDNKPIPGVVPPDVAKEFNMVEVYASTGVFWFKSQMDFVLFNGNNSPEQTMSKAMDVFFDKTVLKDSSAKGGGQFQPLDQQILNACLCFVQERWAIKEAALIKVANDKCSNARRPKRTGAYSHEKYMQKRLKKSEVGQEEHWRIGFATSADADQMGLQTRQSQAVMQESTSGTPTDAQTTSGTLTDAQTMSGTLTDAQTTSGTPADAQTTSGTAADIQAQPLFQFESMI